MRVYRLMKVVICKSQALWLVSGADETRVTYAMQHHRTGVSVSIGKLF